MHHLRILFALLLLPVAFAPAIADEKGKEKEKAYESPYSVKFKHEIKELLPDRESERFAPKREASVPHDEWYSRKIREEYGSWGPAARHYEMPECMKDKSIEWKRERTLAVALRFVGYGYQHHHVPDWDPPKDWPWKEVKIGHNGKGVDCSNFTAFVYNLGFGLKPTGNTKDQSELKEFPWREGKHEVHHLKLPDSYEKLVKELRTGDLLYIRNNTRDIAHVVIWVGSIGKSPKDVPLILDSHGDNVLDANGKHIPCGIHLRPFKEDSWYYKSAVHATRVWHE